MHHRVPLITEALLASMATIIAASARVIMAMIPEGEVDLYRWTLLPLIGSVLATIGAFCFNTEPEVRKIVVGRCTIAFVAGVIGPRLIYVLSPWDGIRSWLVDPLLLVGMGCLFAFVGYILSYPFTRAAYRRAPFIAEQKLKEIEKKIKAESDTKELKP